MSSPDYYSDFNGPAATQHSEDPFVTYCLTLTFITFCALPLFTYFKDSIFWAFLHIGDGIHHIYLYIVQFLTHSLDYIPSGSGPAFSTTQD